MSLGGKDGGEEKEERRMKGALQRVKGAEETKITRYKCISHPFSTYTVRMHLLFPTFLFFLPPSLPFRPSHSLPLPLLFSPLRS